MSSQSSAPLPVSTYPVNFQPGVPVVGDPYLQSDTEITSLHRHDCFEVGYCFSGAGIFMVESKVFPFSAGDAFFCSATEAHLARSAKGTASEWIFIYLDAPTLLGQALSDDLDTLCGPAFKNITSPSQYPELCQVAKWMVTEARDQGSHWQGVLSGLLTTCHSMLKRAGEGDTRAAPSAQDMARISPALEYLGMHMRDELRMAELAAQCHMSEPHFRRMFTRAVGHSPMQHLLKLRIEMAKSILVDKRRTMLDVSLEVGFRNLSSFNRQFKGQTGLSPRQWRQQQTGA